MNIKKVSFLLIGCLFLLPLSLQAQTSHEEPRLTCDVDFRILEMKNEVVFNSNILGKFGINRKISRLTVRIVKINASEQEKEEAPLAFKWLQANAAELDFKTFILSDDERDGLKKAYKKDRNSVFTFKIQVAVSKENGQFTGCAHLLGKALGDSIEDKK